MGLNSDVIIASALGQLVKKITKNQSHIETALKEKVPLGYTGDLKESMRINARHERGVGLVMAVTSDSPYANRQRVEALTHVNKGVIGKRGWQHFARGGGSTKARYFRALHEARKQGQPQYRWDFLREAARTTLTARRLAELLRL